MVGGIEKALALRAGSTLSVENSATLTVGATATLRIDAGSTVTVAGALNVVSNSFVNVEGTLDGTNATGKFDGTVNVKTNGILKVSDVFGTPAGALGSIVVSGNNAQVFHTALSTSAPQVGTAGGVALLEGGTVLTIRAANRQDAATFEVAGNAQVQAEFPLVRGQWVKIASGTTTIAANGGATISGKVSDDSISNYSAGALPKIVIVSGGAKIVNNSTATTKKAVFKNGEYVLSNDNTAEGTYILKETPTWGSGNTWSATWAK
jgi:hypothetical protein